MPKSAGAARYFHFALPVARSIACNSPVDVPTYATPSTMAAEDSTEPPASYVHNTFRVAGSVVDAIPESVGVLRNCGQEDGGGATCGAVTNSVRMKARSMVITPTLQGRP